VSRKLGAQTECEKRCAETKRSETNDSSEDHEYGADSLIESNAMKRQKLANNYAANEHNDRQDAEGLKLVAFAHQSSLPAIASSES
jgi:hypothetical protein